MAEPVEPPRAWVLRGMRGVISVPAAILLLSMAGFGALCRETGLTLAQSVFITAAVWALPSQVVLVGAIAAGASLPIAALGVALSAVRFVPMIASWVPMVRTPRTPTWSLLAVSHFVAVTAWVVSALQLPSVPPHARLGFAAGFAMTLSATGTLVTGLGYLLAGALPPVLAGALFFLTPIYFLTALTAAARIHAERLALAAGLLLGPLFRLAELPLDLVWAGLIGGTAAYAGHRFPRPVVSLTFDSLQAGWWPYLFILIAGTLATDSWRWLGVFLGGALREDSQALIWVKAVATALVAAVVGQLILFPSGELAATPAALRIAAAALGWLAFWLARKSVLVGVVCAEAILIGGWWAI